MVINILGLSWFVLVHFLYIEVLKLHYVQSESLKAYTNCI